MEILAGCGLLTGDHNPAEQEGKPRVRARGRLCMGMARFVYGAQKSWVVRPRYGAAVLAGRAATWRRLLCCCSGQGAQARAIETGKL